MAVDRRIFLAGSAALASAPALGAVAASGETDVAIIGAGTAGIAAARKVAAAGRRFALIEASDRVGGRCFTESRTFGVPYDRGAHWLHMPDLNPLAKLNPRGSGLDVYSAPPGQKLRIARRNAREGEMEDYLASIVRANRAIQDSARGKSDLSCAAGAAEGSRHLARVGRVRARTVRLRQESRRCLGDGLRPLARTRHRRVLPPGTWRAGRQARRRHSGATAHAGHAAAVDAQYGRDRDRARPYPCARRDRHGVDRRAAGRQIKFVPALPKRQIDALAKLSLGSYDHVALELANNPLQLRNDDLVFEKASGARTAALLANVSGTPLCMIEVGGKFGAELSQAGETAMIDFATGWLADLFGADVKKAIGRKHATRWNAEPFALGAFSAAASAARAGARS